MIFRDLVYWILFLVLSIMSPLLMTLLDFLGYFHCNINMMFSHALLIFISLLKDSILISLRC